MTKEFSCYAVVDDNGDDWEEGSLAFTSRYLDECYEWAEWENYHSASIVGVYTDGSRKRVEQP